MSTNHVELALRGIERQALMDLIQTHPEWPVAALLRELERNERRRWLLEELTVGELFTHPCAPKPLKPYTSVELDTAVLAVLAETGDAFVPIRALTSRIEVERSRLGASLRRLAAAGKVERVGRTNRTRYRLGSP